MSKTQIQAVSALARPAAEKDETLIGRIAAADQIAMRTLFVRHRLLVFRYVVRLVRDRTLADDLVADVFLDVWRQASRFEARANVSTWLLTIARYKAISALRRRPHCSLDLAAEVADAAEDPERLAQNRSRSEVMCRCLEMLSRDHREIVDLVYYHDKTVQEVAQIVGIPASTVKTRMFYARKHLAVLLARAGLDRDAL